MFGIEVGVFNEGVECGHAADDISRMAVEETKAEEIVAEKSPGGFDPEVG